MSRSVGSNPTVSAKSEQAIACSDFFYDFEHARIYVDSDLRQSDRHSIRGSPLRLQAMRGMLLPGPCKYCRPCKQIGGTSACMTN